MAPEVLLHKSAVTQAADVWSLGCTLAEFYNEQQIWILDGDEQSL